MGKIKVKKKQYISKRFLLNCSRNGPLTTNLELNTLETVGSGTAEWNVTVVLIISSLFEVKIMTL